MMKRILNFFRNDLWRKLCALVLACLLYWNLSDREKITKHITVPMEIEAAAGLFIPEDFKLEVRTTVKGTERSLRDLKIKGLIKVDRNDRQNGKFRVRLDERNFDRRKDVEVTRVEPETVELPLQLYIQRDVKIIPKTEGKVLEGFELKSLECTPSVIRISGPENEVGAVENIETETLKLDFDRNFTQKLKLLPPQLPNIICSATEVVAKVGISPLVNKRQEFKNIPIRYLLPQSTLAVQKPFSIVSSPSPVSLTITAPPEALENIEPEKLYVVADLSAESFTGQPAKFNIRLYCPSVLTGISNGKIEIHPAAVTLTVTPDKKQK